MKISAVMDITGLTKKAINYYEEEGLISPFVNPENNYREYSQSDVDILVQISVLRQFDVSLKDIRTIISNPKILKANLEQHLARLNNEVKRLEKGRNILRSCLSEFDFEETGLPQLTKQLLALNKSLELDERSRAGFMKRQLERIFPGNFGKMLTIHFSPFLNEPVDSSEKEDAWFSIVRFLDEVEEVNYPEEMVEMYEKLTSEDIEKYENYINKNVEKWLNMTDEGLIMEQEKILGYINRINLDTNMQAENIRVSNISKSLKGLMDDVGYYEKFVKNLKILSKDYNIYTKKMTKFSKLINVKFDDKGKIINAE